VLLGIQKSSPQTKARGMYEILESSLAHKTKHSSHHPTFLGQRENEAGENMLVVAKKETNYASGRAMGKRVKSVWAFIFVPTIFTLITLFSASRKTPTHTSPFFFNATHILRALLSHNCNAQGSWAFLWFGFKRLGF
jgi:uncharacterized protein YqhQ